MRAPQTYQIVFCSHPELVVQQASNMPDASSVASEATRIVGDVEVPARPPDRAGACARARQRLVLRPKPVRAGAAASDA